MAKKGYCPIPMEKRQKGMIKTHEQAVAMGRRGADVTNDKNRKHKTAHELAKEMMNSPAFDSNGNPICDPVDGHQMTWLEVFISKIRSMALSKRGDMQAIKYIIELSGEAPAQNVEANVTFDPAKESRLPIEI